MAKKRDRAEAQRRRWISGRQVAVAVLSILAVIFVFQNRRRTTVRFLVPEVSTQLWVALLVALVTGLVVGVLLGRRR